MFKVVSNDLHKIVRVVYGVQFCKVTDEIEFLIYHETLSWQWVPAKWYVPVTE